MKKILAAFLLLASATAYSQQSPCDLISVQQWDDMHLERAGATVETATIPKELYGTQADMARSDCRYAGKGKRVPPQLVLLSLAEVASKEDEARIRAWLVDFYKTMQAVASDAPPPAIKYKAWQVEGGWCSASVSRFSAPIAGCAGVRNGRFLTINMIDNGPPTGKSEIYRKAAEYFTAILDQVAPP